MGKQTGQVGFHSHGGLGWPSQGLLWALAFAGLYVLVFQLNRLFDPIFSVIDERVSMVFLPAFIRVAAILVAGASGALGLFLGALVSGFMQDLAVLQNLSQSFFTATAPCLAVLLLRFAMAGRPLAITLSLFLLVALLASMFNAMLHHVFWDFYPLTEPVTLVTFWQMLAGDLAGALLGFGFFALVVRAIALVRPQNVSD
jgi:hypothetical protein